MDKKWEILRKKWMGNDNVLFNILDGIKYRETVLIRLPTETRKTTTIRCIKANALKFLAQNFERFNYYHHPYNLYSSLAQFPNLPSMSFNVKVRRQQMDEFNEHYESYIKGYDFLFDIDNEDLKLAYAQMYKLKTMLSEFRVPYTVTFSGGKGFHVRVAYEDFPKYLTEMSYPELSATLKRCAENVNIIHNLNSIDLAIFDLRRIAKAPYSVVYPYYTIALPLSDEQIDNFSLEMVSLPYQLARTKELYKRGTLKRKGTPDGVEAFVRRYTEL
jgi:hypothetical protein